MADEEGEEELPTKPKRNMLLLGLVGLNLLGMVGVGVYVLLFQGGSGGGDEGEAAAEVAEPENTFGPLIEFDPIVANLQEPDATRYAKITMYIEVADDEMGAKLQEIMIPVRDRMVVHLSSITPDETVGEENKKRIKKDLIRIGNEVAGGEIMKNIFFTEFVVQ